MATAIAKYPVIVSRFKQPSANIPHLGGFWLEGEIEDLLAQLASNWPNNELMRSVHSLVMGTSLWIVSMAYGAIHLAEWNDYFPTAAEKWLWCSSAICISASGLVWVSLCLLAKKFARLDDFWIRFLQIQTAWWSFPVIYGLCSIYRTAYVFSRVFLVVEAFISIRKLPASAYSTPKWIQLVPRL